MSDKKQECRGCIGFDEAHTCDEWAQFQIMKKEKDKCRACEAKDRRIAELVVRLESLADAANVFMYHQSNELELESQIDLALAAAQEGE